MSHRCSNCGNALNAAAGAAIRTPGGRATGKIAVRCPKCRTENVIRAAKK